MAGKLISRTVWMLSLISLFTDAASEMLYPIMPAYLNSIGFSVVLIGLLEGLAEATAGLSKGYFGKLSDSMGRRAPFVQLGYGMSALSKPLLGLFLWPVWVFSIRTMDRLGKGIRTGARDAILSGESTPETRGRIFGLHRSLDTLGAVIGPAFALVYLSFNPGMYRPLFAIAFLPGLLAIVCSFLIKEKRNIVPNTAKEKVSFFSFLRYWKESPDAYRKLLRGLLLFALFNSSDMFLLIKARAAGFDNTAVIGLYIFYNIIYAISSYPIGIIADRIGLKKVFICGLVIFVMVYAGMGLTNNHIILGVLFLLYGIYAASTEGVSKAWISNITDRKDTATAIGTFGAFQSICAMLASSFAGLLWFYFGATATFLVAALAVAVAAIYMLTFPFSRPAAQ